jgi:acetoin:2,6-dichlorophenolindophenol oxidoreductase subunit beta
VTVISYSRMMVEAVNALKLTDQNGISVELIDLRSISPWDQTAVVDSAAKTGRVLIVHEAVTRFGVGAEIASTLSEALFGRLKKPVMRLGAAYSPVPFSKPLEAAHAPNAERIAAAIQALVTG